MAIDYLTQVQLWLGAYFLLSSWSWLWRYNRFFKITETTLIGATAGYYFVQAVKNINDIAIGGLLIGRYWQIVPLLLGITLFFRYVKSYAWIQRYGFSYLIAATSIITFRALIVTQVTQQYTAMLRSISLDNPTLIMNSLITVVFTTTVIMYFLFTEKLSSGMPGYKVINTIGRYAFLLALGYYLGITVMTRIAFILDRLQYLFFQVLQLPIV